MNPKKLVVNKTYTHSNGKRYQYKGAYGHSPKPYIFVGEKNDIMFYNKMFVEQLKEV